MTRELFGPGEVRTPPAKCHCGRVLRWQAVEVTSYAEERRAEEDFVYADCACGLRLTLGHPQRAG